MLMITCPVCGLVGDESEFAHGGPAGLARPAPDASERGLRNALYARPNPRGVSRELWCCALGCGKWFEMRRDTVSQKIVSAAPLPTPVAGTGA